MLAPPPALNPAETALRVAGHFGELLQGRMGVDGPVALISLPCPALAVTMAPGDSPLPPGGAAMLAALGLAAPRGVSIQYAMPRGGGAGSSTAALVALARLAGWAGSPLRLARACAAAEGASDPLMFAAPERLLFASRRGRVLRRLPAPGRAEVVGGFLGPDTPTDPGDGRFPDIADLVAGWDAAPARWAALAGESARRTLALRGPQGDPTGALARDTGALGWLIAHTGSARGLVFAPGTVPAGLEGRLAAEGFRQVLRFGVGR